MGRCGWCQSLQFMVGIVHPLQRLTKQDGVQDGRQKIICLNYQEIYVIEQLFWFAEFEKHISNIAWRSRDLGSQGYLTKLVK